MSFPNLMLCATALRKVRSGTTLDASQNLRKLMFDKWQAKARSVEYAQVKEKLVARKVGAAQSRR